MNQETYQNGLKHLLQIEPNFKKFNPAKKINFFLRPEGFEGIASLVIEQQISVQAAESIKRRVFDLMHNISSKEFLKLLTEIAPLNLNISHIISLNGINDIRNYSNPNLLESIKKPFLDSNQSYMLKNQKWIIKNKKPFYLFPNIISIFFDLELNLPQKEIVDNDFPEQNLRFSDHTKVWEFNVKIMNEISNILDAKYVAFLQPTVGLEGVQSEFMNIIGKDSEIVQNTLQHKDYIKNLRKTYKKLKGYCEDLSFCIDISDIAPPSSYNVYSNARHHNQKGNKIIASKIFEKLKF